MQRYETKTLKKMERIFHEGKLNDYFYRDLQDPAVIGVNYHYYYYCFIVIVNSINMGYQSLSLSSASSNY